MLNPARALIRLSAQQQQSGRLFSATASSIPATTTTQSVTQAPAEPNDFDKLYSKLEIELKGNDPAVLKSYSWFATTAAAHLNISVGKWFVHLERLPILGLN